MKTATVPDAMLPFGAKRRRALARLGGGLVVLAGAPGLWRGAAAQSAEGRERPLPAVGSALALADAPLLDGSRFLAKDAQGQVVVLYWWASWCPFCAVQSPLMEQLWQAQRGRGLRFLGLSIDRKAEDAKAYLAKRGYTFPSAHVTPELAQALPKPKGLPVTLVRGRDGRVVMAEAGQLFPEDVEQIARFL